MKIKDSIHGNNFFIYIICTKLIAVLAVVAPPPPPLQDECLLVVEIPRRHVEVTADQHRHLGQCQRPLDRDVIAVVLHRPAGRRRSKLCRHVQLLQEGLVPQLLQHTDTAETRHVAGPRFAFHLLSGQQQLRCGGR